MTDLFIMPPGVAESEATPLVVMNRYAGTVTMTNVRFSIHKHGNRHIPKISGDLQDVLVQKRRPVKDEGVFKTAFIKATGHVVNQDNQIVKSAKAAYVVGRTVYYV